MGAVPYVDACPLAVQSFGSHKRRGAACEGVKNNVAFICAGADHALVERYGFLRRIAYRLRLIASKRWNIPIVSHSDQRINAALVLKDFDIRESVLVRQVGFFLVRIECVSLFLGVEQDIVMFSTKPSLAHAPGLVKP